MVLVFILIVATIYCAGKLYVWVNKDNHRLSYLPSALEVSQIIYAKEESWGFGPGGNETGVIVYKLPQQTITDIQNGNLAYLESLSGKSHSDWRGFFRGWKNTPVVNNGEWGAVVGGDRDVALGAIPRINDYFNRYGFSIDIDDDVQKQIDQIISMPGNYYAYGRIGIIIISPKSRVVVFAYNG